MAKLIADDIKTQVKRRFSGELLVQVFDSIGSTNTWVKDQIKASPLPCGQAIVCAAEHQTAGRGRRGKSWHSPEGGVTFSTACTLPVPSSGIAGLSLLCGAAVCNSLWDYGVADARVKWPNDIFVDDAKLAGILIEVMAAGDSATTVITGIGMNYHRGREAALIDQQSTDFFELTGGTLPERSQLIGNLVARLLLAYSGDLTASVEHLADNWGSYDALRDRFIQCQVAPGELVTGAALGIDNVGRLLVNTGELVRAVSSGSITLLRRESQNSL